VRVQVATAPEGAVQVSVIDQGPGIAPEEQGKLFQPYSRASVRPTGGENSTGLGLAITRRVVTAHGGTVGLNSNVGSGSTFWFTLPIEPPPQQEAGTTPAATGIPGKT
jgi:signal transduction histidine kinase